MFALKETESSQFIGKSATVVPGKAMPFVCTPCAADQQVPGQRVRAGEKPEAATTYCARVRTAPQIVVAPSTFPMAFRGSVPAKDVWGVLSGSLRVERGMHRLLSQPGLQRAGFAMRAFPQSWAGPPLNRDPVAAFATRQLSGHSLGRFAQSTRPPVRSQTSGPV